MALDEPEEVLSISEDVRRRGRGCRGEEICKNEGMKILHLTLKKNWFDRVGVNKFEEYRDESDWIRSRLMTSNGTHKQYDVVQFRNGYRKDSPVKTFKYEGFTWGVGEESWGAAPRKQYIIKLGQQITI